MMRLCKRKGFTLIEIMIVVAIIALLAAIAIPNMLRARHNANEVAAIAALRTISSGSISYRTSNAFYPANLAALTGANPEYLNDDFGDGVRQGYSFNYSGGTNTFNCTATPSTINVTGTRTFYVDESGVIKLNNSSGSPLQ